MEDRPPRMRRLRTHRTDTLGEIQWDEDQQPRQLIDREDWDIQPRRKPRLRIPETPDEVMERPAFNARREVDRIRKQIARERARSKYPAAWTPSEETLRKIRSPKWRPGTPFVDEDHPVPDTPYQPSQEAEPRPTPSPYTPSIPRAPRQMVSEDIPPTQPDEMEPIMSTAEFRNEEAPNTDVRRTELPVIVEGRRVSDGEPLAPGFTRAVTAEGPGPQIRFVDPVRKRPMWDREDLPAWIKDTVKPPKWWGWKFITTTFTTENFGRGDPGYVLNFIQQGTDQNQRVGKAVIFKRLEYRLHFTNADEVYTMRANYTLDGVGTGSTTTVKGTINGGWIVPDSGPTTSVLYGATATAPNGFAIVRGAMGKNCTAPQVETNTPATAAHQTIAGEWLAAATPNIGTFNPGDIHPAQVAGASPGVSYPATAATPPIAVALQQTIPSTPRIDVVNARMWQQYGPKGFTVPASVGSKEVTVPAVTNKRGLDGCEMLGFRVLIVWTRADCTTTLQDAVTHYLEGHVGKGGHTYYVAGAFNMDEYRGTFEVLSDTTWTPNANEYETTLVEEGVRLDHPALYPDPATGLASYGQIFIFLLSNASNASGTGVYLQDGYARLWYEDASDPRSALNN